jgi:hypothetical protein
MFLIGIVELVLVRLLLLVLRWELPWLAWMLILRLLLVTSHLISKDWRLILHAWRWLLESSDLLNDVVLFKLSAHLEVHDTRMVIS